MPVKFLFQLSRNQVVKWNSNKNMKMRAGSKNWFYWTCSAFVRFSDCFESEFQTAKITWTQHCNIWDPFTIVILLKLCGASGNYFHDFLRYKLFFIESIKPCQKRFWWDTNVKNDWSLNQSKSRVNSLY